MQVAQLNIPSNLNLLQDLQASAIMVFCFNQKVALANILSTNSLNCCMFITQNYSGSSAEARCGTPEVRCSHFRVKPTLYNSLFRRHQTGKEESIAAKSPESDLKPGHKRRNLPKRVSHRRRRSAASTHRLKCLHPAPTVGGWGYGGCWTPCIRFSFSYKANVFR